MEHVSQAPEWASALEASGVGLFMRQSLWAYPVANLAHLLGLILLVGPIVLFDLRVVGFGRKRISMENASRVLTPFAFAGLAILLASGPLLFVADARTLALNTLLMAKLALVGVAIVNASAFRVAWARDLATLDAAPPIAARLQAVASIAFWLTIAGLGRMIAYL